ncbi:hypothetical protein ACFXDJ_06955 [Streptomyces sp. NPDC059443]|uniref:hypothetical protein n=1 Tax=unclassified Streptomyces TaxID=2593676 RepID=UPI0036CE0022
MKKPLPKTTGEPATPSGRLKKSAQKVFKKADPGAAQAQRRAAVRQRSKGR